MKPRHYDHEARGFTLRFESMDGSEGLTIIERESGEPRARYPFSNEDLRRVLRGGSFQSNRPEGFLLVRSTSEGIWFLFESAESGLNSSCLVPTQELLVIVA